MPAIDPIWLGAGSMIAAIGSFLAGQRHGKAEFLTAVSKASEIVISRLTKECERVQEAREHCEAGHAECRIEVESLKHKVHILMQGDVAAYSAADLHRVGTKE